MTEDQEEARLLESESIGTISKEDGTSRTANGRFQPNNLQRVPEQQQFVGNMLSRLSVPRVVETGSRHIRRVLTSGINGMTRTQNLL